MNFCNLQLGWWPEWWLRLMCVSRDNVVSAVKYFLFIVTRDNDIWNMRPVFLIIIISNLSLGYNVIRKNPFASLSDTLVTKQQAACDGDILMLECPAKTKISIQLVLYHRSALTKSEFLDSTTTCLWWFHPTHRSQSKKIKLWDKGCCRQNFSRRRLQCCVTVSYIYCGHRSAPSSALCPPTSSQPRIYTAGEGLRCSIKEVLRTVEELCQGKQSCSILTSPASFGVAHLDKCPGIRWENKSLMKISIL